MHGDGMPYMSAVYQRVAEQSPLLAYPFTFSSLKFYYGLDAVIKGKVYQAEPALR